MPQSLMGGVDVALHLIEFGAIALLTLLILGAYRYMGELQDQLRLVAPPITRLQRGDRLPAEVALELPSRCFVLLVSHGCSGCVELCRQLEADSAREWPLVTVVSGPMSQPNVAASGSLLAAGAPPEPFPVPRGSILLHDPARARFKALGAAAYPTALAVVGSHLVDQAIAPRAAWFSDIERRRRGRGLLLRGPGHSKLRDGSSSVDI